MIRCRVCGRRLRTPATAARGIGPTCARNTQQTTPPSARPEVSAKPGPGQQLLFPDAALATIHAAVEDAHLLAEDHDQTTHRVGLYLASSGWQITPAA
ncbi:DUF6011 domain-containing protein [Streptomyces sp. NPDC047315]|uniref:DUF6011 domain-containing protein n=1 Tax=Streptomyces sp. NPDC047315 TaxID=3155142 RepID=UPI0033C01193